MAKQVKKKSRVEGTSEHQHSSTTKNSNFVTVKLKRQQTLPWKPINEKSYKLLLSLLDSTELTLLSENRELINQKEVFQPLTQLKKQISQKLKSIYAPDPKWQNIDAHSCAEWLPKMREKNELLHKAYEEEEREVEELQNELEDLET